MNKCKDNIITGMDKLIEGKLSSGRNITKEYLTPMKNAVIEKGNNKVSILKKRVKLFTISHKIFETNPSFM